MSTYVIGDVQGCYTPLRHLLDKIQFDPSYDQLWFCGDLINRGHESLETLRFVRDLGSSAISVMGNHDLALLVYAENHILKSIEDFDAILAAPDHEELLDWVRHLPLHHQDGNRLLVHAGIWPFWTIEETVRYANEATAVMHSEQWHELVANLFGDLPDAWDPELKDWDRYRFIFNVFTRMRYLRNGRLALAIKGTPDSVEGQYHPWYQHLPKDTTTHIYFGHWSALRGKTNHPQCHALDTGCVWGEQLTAERLEDNQRFQVNCDGACALG
ncbi:MAG: symmetrical bis(5'-nucleosyl)-tetraphosphatase [Pseudomonadota bacterium]